MLHSRPLTALARQHATFAVQRPASGRVFWPRPTHCRASPSSFLQLARWAPGAARQLPTPLRAQRSGSLDGPLSQAIEEDDKVEIEDTSQQAFFQAFVRGLLLGVGAGAIFESAHVALKLVGIWNAVGFSKLADMLPRISDQLAPLFVEDHAFALASWLLFYSIEAIAVVTILNHHSSDPKAAATALQNMVTLPKRMLPLKQQLFKSFVLNKNIPQLATSSAASSAAPSSHAATAPQPQTKSSFVDVLERPEQPSSTATAPAPKRANIPKPTGGVTLPGELVIPGVDIPALPKLPKKPEFPWNDRPAEQMQDLAAAKRRKELNDRRAYLTNVWYAAAASETVISKPKKVEMLGKKLVLFRGRDGKVHCLNDACAHRGAPLSMGWTAEVEGHSCVVCPYHGWAFDDTGVLRDVPSDEDRSTWPKRSLIHSYQVVEKGGFVWLWYGDNEMPTHERPPIPYVPELDDPTWKPVYGEIEFAAGHMSVFENAIDMAHIHYLHDSSFGNSAAPKIQDMRAAADSPTSVLSTFKLHNKPVNALWEWSKVPEVHVTAKAMLPSTSVIGFTLGNGLSFITFVNTVPIGDNRSVNRFCLIRNLSWDKVGMFNAKLWDGMARDAMFKILNEDKAMVEELMPEQVLKEISLKPDLLQIEFRRLRQRHMDAGYAVMPEEVGKYA